MSKMKMSNVFSGKVAQDGDTILADGYGELADFSGYKREARYAAHAINNHDRMVEEIADLRDFVRMVADAGSASDEVKSFMVHSFVYNAKQLLEKLNQEGEE